MMSSSVTVLAKLANMSDGVNTMNTICKVPLTKNFLIKNTKFTDWLPYFSPKTEKLINCKKLKTEIS